MLVLKIKMIVMAKVIVMVTVTLIKRNHGNASTNFTIATAIATLPCALNMALKLVLIYMQRMMVGLLCI